jgi:hypothetical protein
MPSTVYTPGCRRSGAAVAAAKTSENPQDGQSDGPWPLDEPDGQLRDNPAGPFGPCHGPGHIKATFGKQMVEPIP